MTTLMKLFAVLPVSLMISCTMSDTNRLVADKKNLLIQGRADTSKAGQIRFFWPGSSVTVKFRGTHLWATMWDSIGNSWYNVITDNKHIAKLNPATEKKEYLLAELPEGTHTVEIFRRTGFSTGTTVISDIQLNKGAVVLPLEDKKRGIEFYGNSITTGYANQDQSGLDSPNSINTNNYMSYAAITARYFNASYSCISMSGIGYMVSWFPVIMPELYSRLNPNIKSSRWDFHLFQPGIVVVNLGQNDSWILDLPQSKEYLYRFGQNRVQEKDIVVAYSSFIQNLRLHYPDAHIICTLGCMDAVAAESPWPAYISKAVQNLDDHRIFVHQFEFLSPGSHPGISEHKKMAQSLIGFIENRIGW